MKPSGLFAAACSNVVSNSKGIAGLDLCISMLVADFRDVGWLAVPLVRGEIRLIYRSKSLSRPPTLLVFFTDQEDVMRSDKRQEQYFVLIGPSIFLLIHE